MSSSDASTSSNHQSAIPSVDPFGTSTLTKLYTTYNKLSAESDTELLLYLSELIKIHAKALAIAESKFDLGGSGPKIYVKAMNFKKSLDSSLKLLNEFVIAKQQLNLQINDLIHDELVKLVLDEERSTDPSAKSANT